MPTDNAYYSGGPSSPGIAHKPSARERGRMRRRLRRQRRMREALLLDLGALVFELQRQGRREPELLQAKAAELSAVDQEVRGLAHALDAGHTQLELVSTGVAGSCGNCGSLLSTDARYCSACGAPAVLSLGSDPARPRGAALGDHPGGAALDPGSAALDPGGAAVDPGAGLDASYEDAGPEEPTSSDAGPLHRIRGRLGRRNIDG